jgi:PAS domain S-box
MNNINLRTRGRLLVAFPLLWTLIFVAVLLMMLSQVHNELLVQSHSRDVAMTIHELMRDAIDVVSYGYLGHAKNEMMDHDSVSEKVYRTKPQVDRLCKLANSKDQKENINDLQNATKELMEIYNWTLKEQQQGIKNWNSVKGTTDAVMATQLKRFCRALMAISAVEAKKSERSESSVLSEWNSRLELMLSISIATSIGTAIALGILYILGIKRPLGRMTENSRRLSQNQELLPMQRGTNEIAELDRLFHKVSHSINEALRREQAMFDNATDLICALNGEGVFTRANLYAIEVLCYDPEHLVGMNIFDIVVEDDLLTAENYLRGSKGSEIQEFELRLKRQDGIVIDTRWATIWSESEGSVFCVVHDATQEKNIERLKQDFLDMVSHDLRSPLTAMLASMSMIAAGARGELPETAKQEVAESVQDIERLIGFINELLEFQKLQAGRTPIKMQPCNLDSVLGDAARKLDEACQSKGIKINLPVGNWTVTCDREKITQILVQMLLNAIAVTPKDGSIKVDISVPEAGAFVEVAITDSGSSLSIAERELVFNQLASVGGENGGGERAARLGLAVSKLIIEAHGGEIGVRDAAPGNTFWFYLPSFKG